MPNPPKPTKLKVVQGNPGGRPLNANEPQPDVSSAVPPPPPYLSEDQAEVWQHTATRLHKAGLLTNVDEEALALFCVTFARWKWAEGKLQEPPQYVYTMTKEAQGISRDAYVAQGWTDEQLVAYGYMLAPELLDPCVSKTKTGYVSTSPYLQIANKSFTQLKTMLQEFGMTPSARSRVQAAPAAGGDGMDSFLQARKK